MKTFNEYINEANDTKMYTAKSMGNRMTITVKGDKVRMTTDDGTVLALGNAGIQVDGGRAEKDKAVKAAAQKGAEALNKVSGLKWKEINPN